VLADIRKVGLKVVANARDVCVDRVGFDVVQHVGDVETERVRCEFIWEVMVPSEVEI
jgi:hypothetical protein